mmetsp:Transcript_32314/g.58459  ORF Transcript_32314/g.58459 Transcript_32314/m.58459 type:complete len:135 (+) Transcript_32314:240-644(+)
MSYWGDNRIQQMVKTRVKVETTAKVLTRTYVETVAMDESDSPSAEDDSKANDAIGAESFLQDAVIEEQGSVACSSVFGVQTVDTNETVDNETEVKAKVIEEASDKRNMEHGSSFVEKLTKTESLKRPLQKGRDE